MNAPHHGGTPAEMLRDLADFLDALDEFGKRATLPDGTLLFDIFNAGDEDSGTMQADVRWLANRLDRDDWGDLHGRLQNAVRELEQMADETRDIYEAQRLLNRASGVALAIDYMRGYGR